MSNTEVQSTTKFDFALLFITTVCGLLFECLLILKKYSHFITRVGVRVSCVIICELCVVCAFG
jgi:hypothetical protein